MKLLLVLFYSVLVNQLFKLKVNVTPEIQNYILASDLDK